MLMEKPAAAFLSLFTGNVLTFLNNIVSNYFKFALAFSMLEVFSSYSDNTKKIDTKYKSVTKKELCLIGEIHSQPYLTAEKCG